MGSNTEPQRMAALSVLRNRNNQKLREGFEDFLARCSEKSENKNEIDKIFVMESLEKLDVKMDPREREKLQRISNEKNKVKRDDFVQFAKSSKAIKALVEKETKVSSRPGTPVRSRSRKNLKIDKALAAFKALDSDNSGYLDREEFLNFASNLPVKNREKLLKSLDSDGDGRVDLEEFRQLFNKK